MSIRSRLLPYAEWEKIADREPYTNIGMPAQDGHWQIIVVEDATSGGILASCAIFDTVHWDGFQVNPEVQKNPVVFQALLAESLKVLQDNGVPGVHITVPNESPDLQKMVESFGFIEAPGKLYLFQVPPRS